MSDDEFPNDFDGLDFSAVPGLQAQRLQVTELESAPASSSNRSRSSGSTSNIRTGAVVPPIVEPERASPLQHDSDGFEVDSSLLAAIDEIEARALQEQHIVGRSNLGARQGTPSDIPSSSLPCAKKCHPGDKDVVEVSPITPPKPPPPKTKGKAKSESDILLQDILEGYEIEMTCPICCDVLAAAFMTNPCGHTTCGDCGYGWLSRNKYSPTCSVCRSELAKIKPLLPNYAVDNLVKHHVHALKMSGRPEWQECGFKFIEWNKRLGAWKEQYTKILAEERYPEISRKRRYQPHYVEDDPPWLPVEEILLPQPPNGRPRRRNRRT